MKYIQRTIRRMAKLHLWIILTYQSEEGIELKEYQMHVVSLQSSRLVQQIHIVGPEGYDPKG